MKLFDKYPNPIIFKQQMDPNERRDKKKKKIYNSDRMNFSDAELQSQMEEECERISKIVELSQIDKQREINRIYNEKKMKKKLQENKDILMKGQARLKNKPSVEPSTQYQKHIDDQQSGEIIQRDITKTRENDKLPTPTQYDIHIRRLLLTRAKLQDLLNLPRFQQIVTGCFVRYHSAKNNEYSISQILCTIQSSSKVYKVGKVETNLLLKLQISTNEIQNLSMDMVSNQTLTGTLEINRWLHRIGDKAPKISDLVQKRQEFQKKTISQISAEDINKNIIKNIQKIIKKEGQVREDLNSYLSFLNERDHHIQVQLKELQQFTNDEDTGGVGEKQKERRSRFSREVIQRPKITKTKQELLQDKRKIKQYLQKLKVLRQQQIDRKQQKKQTIKVKPEKVYDTRVVRDDRILAKVNQRIDRLATATDVGTVYEQIVKFHKQAEFDIQL